MIWEKHEQIWAKIFCIPQNMRSRTPMFKSLLKQYSHNRAAQLIAAYIFLKQNRLFRRSTSTCYRAAYHHSVVTNLSSSLLITSDCSLPLKWNTFKRLKEITLFFLKKHISSMYMPFENVWYRREPPIHWSTCCVFSVKPWLHLYFSRYGIYVSYTLVRASKKHRLLT